MGEIITERKDILEALHWMVGQRILIEGAGKPLEMKVKNLIETQTEQKDGMVSMPSIKMTDEAGEYVLLKFPRVIEETTTGFIVHLDTPLDYVPPELRKQEFKEEDDRFFEFLRSGRGHRFRGTEKKNKKITITILD